MKDTDREVVFGSDRKSPLNGVIADFHKINILEDVQPFVIQIEEDLFEPDFLVKTNGRGSLVFQEKPKGPVIKGHTFYDGEWIYANRYYRKDGYAVAYDDGVFGFVDASYINWND